jgi:diaminopimelate epimerase
MIVTPPRDAEPAAIRLLNSDGSEPEISGNGTRCAAALLVDAGLAGDDISIRTGAGLKHLRLIQRHGAQFVFEMNMGTPVIAAGDLRFPLPTSLGARECTLLNVGNPQCAFFVDDFEWDWKGFGAEVERHAHFPRRTNVSFIRVVDRSTLDVRFYERGAGFTMSSGTGSTGAYFAALSRGLIDERATVATLAGPLIFRREGANVLMQGPAEITTRGTFLFNA